MPNILNYFIVNLHVENNTCRLIAVYVYVKCYMEHSHKQCLAYFFGLFSRDDDVTALRAITIYC